MTLFYISYHLHQMFLKFLKYLNFFLPLILVVIFDSRSSLGLVRLRVKKATEELNHILDRAVRLKNMLKNKERVRKVSEFIVKHFKEYVEPKVIWVNEYRTTKSGWDSEADAKKYAMDATRIAVKYVEARDE